MTSTETKERKKQIHFYFNWKAAHFKEKFNRWAIILSFFLLKSTKAKLNKQKTYLIAQRSITCQKNGQTAASTPWPDGTTIFGAIFWLRSWMIVHTFGLKKYCIIRWTPEMCDWIPAMATTRPNLQFPIRTCTAMQITIYPLIFSMNEIFSQCKTKYLPIRTWFALLFFPCFVTNGRT